MKDEKLKLIYIIVSTIIAVLLLYISDQILMLPYTWKVVIKLLLFTIIPLGYLLTTHHNVIQESIENLKEIKNIKMSITLGIVVFAIIIVIYAIVKQYIHIDILIQEFEGKYKISKDNIIYYGLYMTFINSLLEELFFRGFIFLNIKKLNYKKCAYIISSLAFAIYHIANFQNWFSVTLFLLASAGLFIGGIIFNYLDDKPNTFFNSWFVHICADLAIILIGFRLFEII